VDKTKPHGEEFELPDSHHTNTLEGETQQSRIFTFIAFFFILNEKHPTLVLHGTFYRSIELFCSVGISSGIDAYSFARSCIVALTGLPAGASEVSHLPHSSAPLPNLIHEMAGSVRMNLNI